MFFPLPTVLFHGDDNEGPRAAAIMQEHGVRIWQMQRHWHYGEREKPYMTHWAMLFTP